MNLRQEPPLDRDHAYKQPIQQCIIRLIHATNGGKFRKLVTPVGTRFASFSAAIPHRGRLAPAASQPALSASTVRPLSLTSAKPPLTAIFSGAAPCVR